MSSQFLIDKLAEIIAPLKLYRCMSRDSIKIVGARVRGEVSGDMMVVLPKYAVADAFSNVIKDMADQDPQVGQWRRDREIEIHPVFVGNVFEVLAN